MTTPFPKKSSCQLCFWGYIPVYELQIFCRLFLNPESKFQVTLFFKNLLVTHYRLFILLFLIECLTNFLVELADVYSCCCCDLLLLFGAAGFSSACLFAICNSKIFLVECARLLNLFDLLSFDHKLIN